MSRQCASASHTTYIPFSFARFNWQDPGISKGYKSAVITLGVIEFVKLSRTPS